MSNRFNVQADTSIPDRKPGIAATAYTAAGDRTQNFIGSKVIRFDDLAKCGDEVWIEHAGQLYRLRKTRHQKLVLSK